MLTNFEDSYILLYYQDYKNIVSTYTVFAIWHTVFSSKASPTIWSCYANLNHYQFL